ncbi:MAG TPA: Asp-tRNA(Asn)/Glu-tRNA(Gln) amidotransferase GatCAB subunit C [Gammaproteobacteria bacterium]|jgi:aspartyl-tRNA(Asn)/glutamyl-tRNA(Gln) amidotransferase subunit C|nr:MAG: Asp-tRNA(Asn)/Glu-tRNA(Gln) amidotransferase subunit GatC [OM182 bacterium]HAL41986.1 Asp-tRNA(Asn)/Glu-tRNA(Gln) amidotransferase GatCAB subunit C [Gammaproteobacteria bacterium]HBK17114.1 Asp-tRNA(Asn)/Glu-tRNA(Gln) amidotransferase GatCAB subunit C [Gammaproteobacteria bacterium]|tara:strand:- start:27919 stop:28215 length:297 start_codon:yes stop_codon:yes gene_type:complete
MSDSSDAGVNIKHLARLSRLAIDADAAAASAKELQSIIEMIDAMQQIETDGVDPLAHPLDIKARLRADQANSDIDRSRFQDIAPETADGYYLVPRVVE